MDIGRTEGVQGPSRIEPKAVHPAKPTDLTPPAAADRLDVSEAGRLASEAIAMSPLRLDRIAELKRQIDAGTYQTDEKLARAFEAFRRENPDLP